MPIRYSASIARFQGVCAIEEAAELTEWLLAKPGRKVDLAPCTALHTALLQSIMALNPPIKAHPSCQPLARWVTPFLPAEIAAPRKSAKLAREKVSA